MPQNLSLHSFNSWPRPLSNLFFTSSTHTCSLFFPSLFLSCYSSKILPLLDKLFVPSSSQGQFPSCFTFSWFYITKVLTFQQHKQNAQKEGKEGNWEESSAMVEESLRIWALTWRHAGLEALQTMCQCPLLSSSALILSCLIFWLVISHRS